MVNHLKSALLALTLLTLAACNTGPAPVSSLATVPGGTTPAARTTALAGTTPAVQTTVPQATPIGRTPAAGPQTTPTSGAVSPSVQATATAEPATAGEVPGTEAALVTYTDATQGFSIARPATWTQDKAVTQGVKFKGGDDSMTLQFVTLPAGTTALAYAQGNVSAVVSAFPGFKQLNLAPSTEVANAIVLAFTANGTSGVTGKTFTAQGDRYYMPTSGGRIAILTIVGPVANYDREGIRDIALTFKATK